MELKYNVDSESSGKKTLATVKKECDLTGQYLCGRSYAYHYFYGDSIANFNFHANPGDLIQIEAYHVEKTPTSDHGYFIGIRLYINNTVMSHTTIGACSIIENIPVYFYTEVDFYLTSSIPKRFTPEPPVLIKFDNSLTTITQPLTINIPFPAINENYKIPFAISIYYALLDINKNIVLKETSFSLDTATKSGSYDTKLRIIPKIKSKLLGCDIELLGVNGYDFKDSYDNYNCSDHTELYFSLNDIKFSRSFNQTVGIIQLNSDYNINVVEVIGTEPFIAENYSDIVKNEVAIDGGIRFTCNNLIDFNSMSNMFYYCDKITSIKFSNFINTNIRDMSSMFDSCTNLISIDFSTSNLDTSNVTDMNRMFMDCENLKSIICPDGLDLSMCTGSGALDDMFSDCPEFESPLHLRNVDSSLIESGSSPDDWVVSNIGGTRGIHYIVDSVI